MIKFSFKSPVFPTRPSMEGGNWPSGFPFGAWFYRTGRVSALAACLMAATPLSGWAQEPFPTEMAAAESSDALAALVTSLRSEDPEVRKAAVEKLAWLEDATAALPELLKVLQDSDPVVRATAARAVWEVDQRAQEAVPVLVELLKSDNPSHRELAAYFLGPMGPAAKPAVPVLRETLADKNVSLRIHAAEALAQIDPASAEAVDVLVEAMKSPDANLRSLAAMAFGNVDPSHAEKVVPVLMTAAVDSDPGVRTAAELSLPAFNVDVAHSSEPFPMSMEPAPFDAAENPFTAETSPAPTQENSTPFASPEELPSQPPQILSELDRAVRELSDENPAVRRGALERLAWMGAEAKSAAPEVTKALEDPHPGIQVYAAKTLWDLDKDSGETAIGKLRDLLDSTHPGIRPLAAFHLGYIGRPAASALPVLKRALANAESTEQLQIAEAVARVNPEDPDAVNVLIGGLRDPESGVRFQAAYALSEVSPIHAERVIPELAAAMADQSPQVRQAATVAMANFPPKPIPTTADTPDTATPVSESAAEPQPAETVQVAQVDAVPTAPTPTVPVEDVGEFEPIPAAQQPAQAVQFKENRLGLGEDYKPLSAVNIVIAPKRRDEEGNLLALPTNYGAAWLQELGQHYQPVGESRPWTVTPMQYAASAFCHRPLYFEEVNLERYGHNFGCVLQPFVSAGAFFGRVPLMPYMMAADHPWECQYTLGHYRPGNCVPFQHMHLPWSTAGTLIEAGIITGLFFAIY